MKLSIRIILLTILCLMFFACSKSPQEKIVGIWENIDLPEGKKSQFFSDGTYFEDYSFGDTAKGKWTLSGNPLVLNIFENGHNIFSVNIEFISNDEIELYWEGQKFTLRRFDPSTIK